MAKDVIIACDFSSKEETLKFLDNFKTVKPFVKIGMELFYGAGPEIVKEIKKRGHKIFLDLKLHDIPNTVKKTMAVLSNLDVDMTNLHASGSIKMMQFALEGLTRADGTRPILIAVTQLTSTDKETMNNELGIEGEVADVVDKYAQNAKIAGLDGDQKRIASPAYARELGSDYIVVGRPITAAEDPVAAYNRCVKEFVKGE